MHLQWFRNYLSNRKQYIQIDVWQKTNYKTVKCGVSQGSSLGSLLFLVYINDLQFSSDLDPIMFAEEKNSNKAINNVFLKVNDELQKINKWFTSNKLSLSVKKTPNTRFSTSLEKKDDIPLILEKLNINNREIARTESIKFLGILLDGNLSWKTYKIH